MPRPPLTQEEIATTRTRILREAAVIVRERGIDGLSMRHLAERLGLTPGALYRYFPSKQEMLLSYWQSALEAIAARVKAIDAAESYSPTAIIRMLSAYADFCLEDQDRFRMIFLERDQDVGSELFQRISGFAPYDLLTKRVIDAIKAGFFLPGDANLTTQTLWAGVHGAVTLLITVKELELAKAEDLVGNTISALLRGLAAKET